MGRLARVTRGGREWRELVMEICGLIIRERTVGTHWRPKLK